MDAIINYFESSNVDLVLLAKAGMILLLGSLIFGLLGRFVFGGKSLFNHAISSAIAIIFIYALTVVLRSCGAKWDQFVAPLPFIEIVGTDLALISLKSLHYTALCSQILSMIILAFLVNLAEGWFSRGKSFFSWLFFRVLTVATGFIMHLVVTALFNHFLPEGLVTYAPTVLLVLLVLLLATGLMKIVVGALISTVNPIIGGLYTFFFANMIGKKITRAVLTTAFIAGLVMLLEYVGIGVITIAAGALMAYVPFLVLLAILWYIINKIL